MNKLVYLTVIFAILASTYAGKGFYCVLKKGESVKILIELKSVNVMTRKIHTLGQLFALTS